MVDSVYDDISNDDLENIIAFEAVDADEDGVIDDWDMCPETANGTATDAEGCEVKVESEDDSESGGGLPGFTVMLTIRALIGAIVYTNRIKRID